MDVLTLSRIQFAATISFHYIYPPLSIGLGVMLVIFEALWLKSKNPLYHQLARFWTRVFGLTFAIGVPIALACTVSIYWIFRGKVKLDRMSY